MWVVAWGAAGFLLSSIANGFVNLLGRMVVANVAGPLAVVLLAVGAVLALMAVVNLMLSLLSTAAFSTLLVNLFVDLGDTKDIDLSELVSAESAETKFALMLTRRNVVTATILLAVGATIVGAVVLYNLRLEDKSQVTAHRGASAAAPENTLAALRQAIEDDADWVEIDVQETADGEVVMMHDSDFKKIAGKDLKIWDATMDDLKDLDIGSWFSPEFQDERVATLDQVLELCKGKVGVNIELKSYGHGQQLEESVIDCVERHEVEYAIVIMSLKRDAVKKMKQLRPKWTVGLLTAVAFGDLTKEEADFVAVSVDIATRSFIRSAHDAGKEVHVWTVNDAITMSTMIGRGADNLITDEPALARSVLTQRKTMNSMERLLIEAAMFFKAQPKEYVVFKSSAVSPLAFGSGNPPRTTRVFDQPPLSKKPSHNLRAFRAGKAVVAPAMMKGQLVVAEAQELQDRGVQVAEVDFTFDGASSSVVSSSVHVSWFHAAAGKPECEAASIVAGFIFAVSVVRTIAYTPPGVATMAAPSEGSRRKFTTSLSEWGTSSWEW